jgi:hypothetical protein
MNLNQLNLNDFIYNLFQLRSNESYLILKQYLHTSLLIDPEARPFITKEWQSRLKWNSLPDDLWLSIWNYLKQKVYRCSATRLNKHCLQLSKQRKCRTRSSIEFTHRIESTVARKVLLRLEQPIIELKLYSADIFEFDQVKTLYPAIQQVQCLDLSMSYAQPRSLSVVNMLCLFQNMKEIRKLHIDTNIIDFNSDLSRHDELRLCTSLIQLEELHLKFNSEKKWMCELLKLPQLRIVSVKNMVSHPDITMMTFCLEQLSLDACNFNWYVPSQVQHLRNLTHLVSKYSSNNRSSAKYFLRAPGFKSLQRIQHLSLERWCLEDTALLASCAFISNLQHLAINGIVFSPSLFTDLSKCSNLKSLEIKFLLTYREWQLFSLRIIEWCKNLTSVCMITASASDTMRLDILSLLCCMQCVHLQHLQLCPIPDWWNILFQSHCHCCSINHLLEYYHKTEIVGGDFVDIFGKSSFQSLLHTHCNGIIK